MSGYMYLFLYLEHFYEGLGSIRVSYVFGSIWLLVSCNSIAKFDGMYNISKILNKLYCVSFYFIVTVTQRPWMLGKNVEMCVFFNKLSAS